MCFGCFCSGGPAEPKFCPWPNPNSATRRQVALVCVGGTPWARNTPRTPRDRPLGGSTSSSGMSRQGSESRPTLFRFGRCTPVNVLKHTHWESNCWNKTAAHGDRSALGPSTCVLSLAIPLNLHLRMHRDAEAGGAPRCRPPLTSPQDAFASRPAPMSSPLLREASAHNRKGSETFH